MQIDRRSLLKALGLLGAGSAVGCGVRPTNMGMDAAGASDASSDALPRQDAADALHGPNILVIVVDQERAKRWFPDGVSMPARESVARAGAVFSRHYTNAMPCTPSRSVMYTGQHVKGTGMRSNIGFGQEPMQTAIPTLGTMLYARGYSTNYLGKWHLSDIDSGDSCSNNTRAALQPYGFEVYNECGDIPGKALSGYRDDPGVATSVRDWIQRRPTSGDDRPWLLCCNFVNPHDIMFFYGGAPLMGFGTPAPNDALYRQNWNVQLPPTAAEDLSTKPGAHAGYKQLYDTFQRYPDNPLGQAGLRNFINYYINCLLDVDRHIQVVLDALAASPFASNTIIVLTSDHGEMAQAHGLRGKGPFVYEENNHVPLAIIDPRNGAAAGRRVDALSCHLDFTPTILALAGQPLAQTRERYPSVAGVDLSAYLRGETPAVQRESLLMTFDFGGTIALPGMASPGMNTARRTFVRGMFDGRYKFARYFASNDYHLPTTFDELVSRNDLELYDLMADPNEQTNLAFDPTPMRALIEQSNAKLNALITNEAGGEFTAT